MGSGTPVIQLASSLARNTATLATSAGFPMPPKGCAALIAARDDGVAVTSVVMAVFRTAGLVSRKRWRRSLVAFGHGSMVGEQRAHVKAELTGTE